MPRGRSGNTRHQAIFSCVKLPRQSIRLSISPARHARLYAGALPVWLTRGGSMDFLLSHPGWLVLGAVGLLGLLLHLYGKSFTSAEPQREMLPHRDDGMAADTDTIYHIAARVGEFYAVSAQPSDLLNYEDFEKGIALRNMTP